MPAVAHVADTVNATFAQRLATQAQAALIRHVYRRALAAVPSRDEVGRLSPAQRAVLFDVAAKAAFFTADAQASQTARLVHTIMAGRGETRPAQDGLLLSALLMAGDVDAARQLPGVVIPAGLANTDSAQRSPVWELASDGSTFQRAAPLGPDASFLLLISSPYCHFSEHALAALSKVSALAGKVYLLNKFDSNFNLDDFRAWSQRYTAGRAGLILNYNGWDEWASTDTPSFYFYRQGVLVYRFSGWPQEGNMPLLQAGLRRMGLPEPATP